MIKNFPTRLILIMLIALFSAAFTFAQKRAPAKQKPKTVIFAVVDDGERMEPIGEIDKGELAETVGGDSEPKSLASFAQTYYRPRMTYDLIFGGAKNGTVTIKNDNVKSECAKNAATVSVTSAKAKMKGMVMGLATNQAPQKSATGVRRLPTAAERAEIETLVRAEFIKQKVAANAVKTLKYQNLIALDVDSDGKAEMVGSFWAENAPNERNLLFFIAEKGKSGKYEFGFSEYRKVTPAEVMSNDVKDLDAGIYHELLLDAFEYDGDSTAEIFTVSKAFESYNYSVYSRRAGKWTRVFESSNYHCAF